MKIITIKVEAGSVTPIVNAIKEWPIMRLYDYTIRVETPKKEGEK